MDNELLSSVSAEHTVRRSRFVAGLTPASSLKTAEAIISRAKDAHPTANHVVYAYRIGDANSVTAGMSDAGEPKGTAAKPIMAVLTGAGITNAVLTVVRYFGGTKLGTGGLVKAYTVSAQLVVQQSSVRPLVQREHLSLQIPYRFSDAVQRYLEDRRISVKDAQFGTDVTLLIELKTEDRATIQTRISDLTHGTCLVSERSS